MSLNSALYVGTVSHHRLKPKHYALRSRVYWLLLDLSELDVLDHSLKLFSRNRLNIVSFYDRDHGDGSGGSLLDYAIDHLHAAGIEEVGVNVKLLTMPRVAGYDFNPLSVYFCSDRDHRLIAIIYEVRNTFGGRHSYVVPVDMPKPAGAAVRQACEKAFYVSPFMHNDMVYRFRTRVPDEAVSVAVQARRNDEAVINTALIGKRQNLDDRGLATLALTHPLLPLKVTTSIYWHGLKLWLRGFAVNPEKPSTAVTHTIVRSHK